MSIFMLETSVLDSASSALSNIASHVLELSNNVSGYDTSCEDGFDFASVKNKIASNIEACSTKIQNTASILNSVSQSHTQLQTSLKFEDPTAKKSTGKSRSSKSYGYYGGVYAGAGYLAGAVGASINNDKADKVVKVENNFTNVAYAYVNDDALSGVSKLIFSSEKLKYDENGYARIDNYYVISASTSVGKVGDMIKFTQNDGKIIEAIIGVNSTDENDAGIINFIVSPEKSSGFDAIDSTENLLKNNTKIENLGTYKLATLSNGSSSNQVLIDSLMGEVGKTIADYPGLGFHDGNWCADFVSQMLVDNGYDVQKSAVAGDGQGQIFGSLRDAGGVVHLDSAASVRGLSSSKEYDPSYSPQPGDVVLFDWGRNGCNDHVGFVVKDNGNGTITTLEGNTSGDAGGSCVAIKIRDRSEVYGYCTLNRNNE